MASNKKKKHIPAILPHYWVASITKKPISDFVEDLFATETPITGVHPS